MSDNDYIEIARKLIKGGRNQEYLGEDTKRKVLFVLRMMLQDALDKNHFKESGRIREVIDRLLE